ncbi:MAG: YciI family protein [Lautropia sp.]
MSYMLLIVEPVGQRDERGLEAGKDAYAEMLRFTADLESRGLLEASNSLSTQAKAARVSVREGQSRIVDGPFAEAREMIGGFFLLKVDTRDEAIEIARRCPAAAWATVEVRGVGPCYE